MADTLLALGVTPAEPDEEQEVQQQQTEAAPMLLNAQATLAQISVKIRLMVVAFTLSYWNVPLSRIALWMGVSPSTVLNWVPGLAVVLDPLIHAWIVDMVTAASLAVDEATGLPVAMTVLQTRTTWACCWFLLTLKRLGLRPLAIITDGLAGHASHIQVIFPFTTHLLCLFHHQQGVTRWLHDHTAEKGGGDAEAEDDTGRPGLRSPHRATGG